MIALDTNVLVRLLVRDDEIQYQKTLTFLTNIEQEKKQAFISVLVILEVIWVLGNHYNINRIDIITKLLELLNIPTFHFENPQGIKELLNNAKSNNYDLSDLMIAYHCKHHQALPVMTFDKKASKFEMFKLM
ncbi:MAG: type II toxin-antitoxin system VapC family toxin [Moraxellaceae bacterium]|nr:type II toxin-antitoxin system VapC family toxin [Moraxellaceae bacterium]